VDNYQPLSYDSYKFFVKFSPYIEKILVNNINKHYFQNNLAEIKSFSKLESEFSLRKELIYYLNISRLSEYQIKFNSKNYNYSFFRLFNKLKNQFKY